VAGRTYGAAAVRPYGAEGAWGWHNPAHAAYHSGWVHGYWNGHYPGWGWGWGGYGAGLATGLAAWGLGSALYSGWGYMPYYNPYYAFAAPVTGVQQPVYDYSQPIETSAAPPDSSVTEPALTAFDEAREAFQAGDYNRALGLTDQALKAMPNDSAIHEFRALVLFALQRYGEAAAALYGVLSVGPGWDWTTLISLYPSIDAYTAQLRALEQFVTAHPDSAAGRFLLAYLYLTAGQNDAAIEELKIVTALQPKDRVSAQLLQSLTSAAPPTTASGEAPASVNTPQQKPAEPAKQRSIDGTWTASPDQDSTITLTVAAATFTWKVTAKGQSHQLTGQSTYANGLLTLVQGEGGPPLVGEVTWQDDNAFVFHALGGGQGDPGLTFRRSS
jgi:tetratricopeptide (TPR) repeat protein